MKGQEDTRKRKTANGQGDIECAIRQDSLLSTFQNIRLSLCLRMRAWGWESLDFLEFHAGFNKISLSQSRHGVPAISAQQLAPNNCPDNICPANLAPPPPAATEPINFCTRFLLYYFVDRLRSVATLASPQASP